MWVSYQRAKQASIGPDRRQRLEGLPGWSWDPISDQWEEGFSHLTQFVDRKKHCRVAAQYKTRDGYRLGPWLQRQRRNKDTMEPNRRERLEALPGWSWDPFFDQWEEGFSHLKRFAERKGHCRIYSRHETEGGYRLGQWIGVQRTQRVTMNPDRRQRLEALPGWVWKVTK
jgi:hypothetical protein